MLTIEFNKPKMSRRWLTTADHFHYPHDKPADTLWHPNGQKYYEHYCLNGHLHRENDKPAITGWYTNGQKAYESYYLNDIHYIPKKTNMLTIEFNEPKVTRQWRTTTKQLHHPHDKPAYTYWHSNGQKCHEFHFLNNHCHRDNDKPAHTAWHPNGQKHYEQHYLNSHYHRDNDKPARTYWNNNGQKAYELYYLNGIQCTPRKTTC